MANHAEVDSLERVRHYYAQRLAQHGATPAGVDWNSGGSQALRFSQLLKLTEGRRHFSLNDLGCGYGALLAHIQAGGQECDYLGIDIEPSMVCAARDMHGSKGRFEHGTRFDRRADYTVASGIFNVRLATDTLTWKSYILDTLGQMNEMSECGFAFNCLTSYSEPERMRNDLHYANPLTLFDHCKRHYSRNVALLHDYGLYEFTILVRKDA